MPMRRTTQIKVEKVILHLLHRDQSTPQLSQVAIPADSDPRIFAYFQEHIENSLRDEQARVARFLDLQTEVPAVCTGLLGGGLDFVEGSQRLAKKLHRIILGDRRIASGDLVVCLYQGRIRDRTGSFLALMKMDPGTGFRQVRRRDPEGHSYLTFEIEDQIMPTLGERLQKCAFLRPLAPRRPQRYDLLLLDRQIRTPVGPQVAKFFSEDFLGVSEVFSPQEAALMLYREVRATLKLLKSQIDPEAYEDLEQVVLGELMSGEVDLEGLVTRAEATVADEQKKDVEREFRRVSEFPQRILPVSPTVIRQVVAEERAREFEIWVGDQGLRVEKPVTYPDDFWSVKYSPEGSPAYTIVIRSNKWEPLELQRKRVQPVAETMVPPALLKSA
jgi:nucleoid associated protein NdpA